MFFACEQERECVTLFVYYCFPELVHVLHVYVYFYVCFRIVVYVCGSECSNASIIECTVSERLWVGVILCVCGVFVSVCVCVFVTKTRMYLSVCVGERKNVCVCVCVCGGGDADFVAGRQMLQKSYLF